MIVTMQKLRIVGPRERLVATVRALQDLGTLHVCPPALAPPLSPARADPRQRRHEQTVRAALEDVEETLSRLGADAGRGGDRAAIPREPLPREVRLARRARRAALSLVGALHTLEDQRDGLVALADQLDAFASLESAAAAPGRRVVFVVLSRDHRSGLEDLERTIADAIEGDLSVHSRPLPDSELAVALSVPAHEAERIDALLPEAGVRELDLPEGLERGGPAAAAEQVRRRLEAVEARIAALESRRRRMAEWMRPGLLRARAAFHDWLIASEATTHAGVTEHLFVIEGWLPADARPALARALRERVDEAIVIEDVAREDWASYDVPVAVRNPPLFRPFELITRRLPAPRYGTLDPTPFVAVFFPMFFGLILGDIGYGTLLIVLSALGWRRSRPGSTLRAVSQIGVACACFSILFGVFFGELFGDLGHRLFGLHTLSFAREEAVIPFLLLAVSIGFVHVVLGLVLGAISGMRTDARESLGRGVTALMLVLSAMVLLAAVNVLPSAFFRPTVVVLLLTFPVLIFLEGFVGTVELFSRVSNILSYARIMALGTASVMLATVANEMVGMMGGAAVGVLFATLFHVVNFGLGVFSPTIHGLRLHFVEFFGTFYSPGKQVYRPLRHWRPVGEPAPQGA